MNTMRFIGLICVVIISQNTYTGRIFKRVPAWKNPNTETLRVYTRTAWLLKSLQNNSITIGEAANSFHSIATIIAQHNSQLGVQKGALFNNMRTLSNLLRIELPSCIDGGYILGASEPESDSDDDELQMLDGSGDEEPSSDLSNPSSENEDEAEESNPSSSSSSSSEEDESSDDSDGD